MIASYKGIQPVIHESVFIAEGAVVHGCTIEDDCLIGIGAIVLNGAHMKKGSVVAAGSVVLEGQVVGPYQLVAGAPAKVKRELDEESLKPFLQPAKRYLQHAAGHREIDTNSK